MKKFAITTVFYAVVFFAAFVAFDYAFGLPDVMMSYSTNQCVQVQNYPTVLFGTSQYSCETMPEKFNLVWVK